MVAAKSELGLNHTVIWPKGGNKEVYPFKDKTSESRYGYVKSQMETLTEKMRIMESSSSWGSDDLDSLTNFP